MIQQFEFSSIIAHPTKQNTRMNPQIPPQQAQDNPFVWTAILHQQFVNAVRELGPRATPSLILQQLNHPGLTREQVAEHLLKFHKLRRETPSSDCNK
jgi:SHAQKYF class myb-like DNA-binding protein